MKRMPLCREPWENYYILRRGIIPCCYGNAVLAPMSGWAEAWNSPQLEEIRRPLSRGRLSPYCLGSPACPMVQRYQERRKQRVSSLPVFLRFINRMLFRIPGRVYWALKKYPIR